MNNHQAPHFDIFVDSLFDRLDMQFKLKVYFTK